MKRIKLPLICLLFVFSVGYAQNAQQGSIISSENLSFLEGMTKDVLEASRIYPGQFISKDFADSF